MLINEEVNKELMSVDELAVTFAALANTTRLEMLTRLAEGEASVNELAEPFDMTLPAISRHIAVLERAGLVTRGRRAQSRPCSINPEPLVAVMSWADQYRHIWDARMDQMGDYLAAIQDPASASNPGASNPGISDSATSNSNAANPKRNEKKNDRQ